MITAAPAGRGEPDHNSNNGHATRPTYDADRAAPSIRYAVRGWFQEHAGAEVRASYVGALKLVGDVYAFENDWHGIGLRHGHAVEEDKFDPEVDFLAFVSLRVVEDASVDNDEVLTLTLLDGDTLTLVAGGDESGHWTELQAEQRYARLADHHGP
jgi:hypothetical protein